jgi:thiamine pyrophosphokinase
MPGDRLRRILIVGGAALAVPGKLPVWAAGYGAIVAADSGLDNTVAAGLEADLVIGDLDSASQAALATLPHDARIHSESQEETDLEKAIKWAISNQARTIGLACVSGDRIDHTFNAVSLMLRYKNEAEFVLYDDHGEARLAVAPEVTIRGRIGQKVSLVPAPAAFNLRSQGLRYPLRGMDLVFGGKDGISNQLTAEAAKVAFDSGSFLVYQQVP